MKNESFGNWWLYVGEKVREFRDSPEEKETVTNRFVSFTLRKVGNAIEVENFKEARK